MRLTGHVGRQPLLDIISTESNSPPAGPSDSFSTFHDYFTTAYGPARAPGDASPHPYRSFFLDAVPIVFTHADLHPSNIMLSSGPPMQSCGDHRLAPVEVVFGVLGVLQSAVDGKDWRGVGGEMVIDDIGQELGF